MLEQPWAERQLGEQKEPSQSGHPLSRGWGELGAFAGSLLAHGAHPDIETLVKIVPSSHGSFREDGGTWAAYVPLD